MTRSERAIDFGFGLLKVVNSCHYFFRMFKTWECLKESRRYNAISRASKMRFAVNYSHLKISKSKKDAT
jgi:hypothetical protein